MRHALARTGAVLAAVAALAIVGYGLTGDGGRFTGILLGNTFLMGIATTVLFADVRHRYQRPIALAVLSVGVIIFAVIAFHAPPS